MLPDTAVDRVQFFINNAPVSTENFAPFDLASGSSNAANPFSTNDLSNGQHTLRAEVLFNNGSSDSISANFVIDNGSNTPSSAVSIVRSAAGDRLNASNLNGQTVKDNIYVQVAPNDDVDRVQFFIDGNQISTENNAKRRSE